MTADITFYPHVCLTNQPIMLILFHFSLAFLYESAAVYKYKAARGQREREQEIYEVLPPSIEVCTLCKSGSNEKNNNNNNSKSKTINKLIRKASFYRQS